MMSVRAYTVVGCSGTRHNYCDVDAYLARMPERLAAFQKWSPHRLAGPWTLRVVVMEVFLWGGSRDLKRFEIQVNEFPAPEAGGPGNYPGRPGVVKVEETLARLREELAGLPSNQYRFCSIISGLVPNGPANDPYTWTVPFGPQEFELVRLP